MNRSVEFCCRGTARRGLFLFLCGIVLSVPAGAMAQSSPWQALEQFTWKADTTASFEGDKQATGSYQHDITVYKLDDQGDTESDWYRVDMRIQAAISHYRKGENVCGWWTDKVQGAFKLQTDSGEILDYAPQTSQGSSTKTYTVGIKASLSGNIRPISKYEVTQVADKSGIKVNIDPAAKAMAWTANLEGCRKVGDVFSYQGASNMAKSTFVLVPTVLVMVPDGAGLSFKTSALGKENGFVQAKQRRDKDAKKKSFDFVYTISCDSTKCTAK